MLTKKQEVKTSFGKLSISITNLTKRLGKQTVLNNLSLEIGAGQMLAVVGPSGCGKSTLLRLLAGFLTPDTGQIYFDGQSVQQLPPEKRPTSLVFQNYALWPHKTIFDNIAFGLRIRGWKRQKVAARVQEMLELVDLTDLAQRYPSQLSGGQQQRVALARSLAISPGILLLDEPLSNLDAQIRLLMRDELRRLQQKVGITTVYVTHDQSEALSIADQMVVLRAGSVEQQDCPPQIYARPASPFVAQFVGESNLLYGEIVNLDEHLIRAIVQPKLPISIFDRNNMGSLNPIRNNPATTVAATSEKLNYFLGGATVGETGKNIVSASNSTDNATGNMVVVGLSQNLVFSPAPIPGSAIKAAAASSSPSPKIGSQVVVAIKPEQIELVSAPQLQSQTTKNIQTPTAVNHTTGEDAWAEGSLDIINFLGNGWHLTFSTAWGLLNVKLNQEQYQRLLENRGQLPLKIGERLVLRVPHQKTLFYNV